MIHLLLWLICDIFHSYIRVIFFSTSYLYPSFKMYLNSLLLFSLYQISFANSKTLVPSLVERLKSLLSAFLLTIHW
jgi:hypothetical protein